MPAFSHPIVSTGASSEDLIFLIPSRTFSQLGGGSPVLKKLCHLTHHTNSCENIFPAKRQIAVPQNSDIHIKIGII